MAISQTHTTGSDFRGDINGIKDRKQNQRMHFTSRHYLLYQLAKQMETHKTNPVLGFRTAGSDAEHKTGDFYMKK